MEHYDLIGKINSLTDKGTELCAFSSTAKNFKTTQKHHTQNERKGVDLLKQSEYYYGSFTSRKYNTLVTSYSFSCPEQPIRTRHNNDVAHQ